MFVIQYTPMRVIGGGYYGTYGSTYQANLARPPSAGGNSESGASGTSKPGWNVAPTPGSNAYGNGWGEDNNGLG